MIKTVKRLVHEGEYVAEVEVNVEVVNEPRAPYITQESADRLDRVRDALRKGDPQTAGQLARVFQLTPLDI